MQRLWWANLRHSLSLPNHYNLRWRCEPHWWGMCQFQMHRHMFASLFASYNEILQWLDWHRQLSEFDLVTSRTRTFISILISKRNVSSIQLLTHSIIKIFRQQRSWNILRKVCIKNIFCNSQAAGWHMHANCHTPIRSCFFHKRIC